MKQVIKYVRWLHMVYPLMYCVFVNILPMFISPVNGTFISTHTKGDFAPQINSTLKEEEKNYLFHSDVKRKLRYSSLEC